MNKGQQGYIDHTRKKNLMFGLTGITAMFLIYIVGLMITGTNSSFGTLLAVLVALPAAQMLTRYFSLMKYHSVSEQMVKDLEDLKNVTCLYELIVVQGKVNHFVEAAVITNSSLWILDHKGIIKSDVIQKMLYHKGIQVQVYVCKSHLEIIAQEDMSEVRNVKIQEPVAKKLLENAL